MTEATLGALGNRREAATQTLTMGEIPTARAGYREMAMKAVGRYDSGLQMFVEEPREPDLRRLTFLRWLVENDRLEHALIGPASGELVAVPIEDAIIGLPLAS